MSTVIYPANGWLPPGAHLEFKQDDQGKDFATNWGGVIQAPGNGQCVAVGHDAPFPGGFGPNYPLVRIDTGPFARSLPWYLGHTTALVAPGESFGFGHPLSVANQGHNWLGTTGGWVELGTQLSDGSLGPMANYHWFDPLLAKSLVHTTKTDMEIGMSGWNILWMTGLLRDCGWLPRAYWKFRRPVHGAVVAFQRYHNLTVDGVVGPRTEITLRHAAHWCRKHHRKEHRP